MGWAAAFDGGLIWNDVALLFAVSEPPLPYLYLYLYLDSWALGHLYFLVASAFLCPHGHAKGSTVSPIANSGSPWLDSLNPALPGGSCPFFPPPTHTNRV
ncbi:MAG: hypothetical protein U1E05_22145, partial [Patescibacteria group bacterium]|nr:hypothetical protein [Patescibacteria group bacterium]